MIILMAKMNRHNSCYTVMICRFIYMYVFIDKSYTETESERDGSTDIHSTHIRHRHQRREEKKYFTYFCVEFVFLSIYFGPWLSSHYIRTTNDRANTKTSKTIHGVVETLDIFEMVSLCVWILLSDIRLVWSFSNRATTIKCTQHTQN